MEYRAKAKAAWQRSIEVVRGFWLLCPIDLSTNIVTQNPDEWPAHLLLGLEAINSSKQLDPRQHRSEDERTQSFMRGTKLIEKAFNKNQKSASAANALCELFLRKGNYTRVSTACFVVLLD
jgi:RNA polymerase-associated protein CTR9